MKKLDFMTKVKIILFPLCFLALMAVVLLAVKWLDREPVPTEPGAATVAATGETQPEYDLEFLGEHYRLKQDLETILLIGVDKYADQSEDYGVTNTQQSDFLELLVLDRSAGVCTTLLLNRDTMAEIPKLDLTGREVDGFTGQLALAHTYGSGGLDSARNTAKAVSRFLGNMEIDHYIAVTMDAIEIINDAVGGVEVTVTDDFSAVTDRLPMGQTVTLHGSDALLFVRARRSMDDPTNLNRMERQKVYLQGLLKKLQQKSGKSEGFLLETIFKLANYLTSDCSAEKLASLFEDCMATDIRVHDSIAGEAVRGSEFMEFYPEEESLALTILDLFYEKVPG